MVLRGVSFDVAPGQKVAVCGRTGSGKSSLFAALARLYPLSSGSVTVDGQDLDGLSLADARAKVRVVSQDATLVADTLRRNLLGPNAEEVGAPNDLGVADDAIWKALELVRVADAVRNLEDGLDHAVAENGDDFSAGEKQLLNLARALLPDHPPLLLCDEATANVDERTDATVHDVLLDMLDATVLVICHRMQHVHRFDTVIILDRGTTLEVGDPTALLRDPNSHLSRLRHSALGRD